MIGLSEAPGHPALDSLGSAVALGLASGLLSALVFKFEFDPIFWIGLVDRDFPYPILIALCFAGAVAIVVRRGGGRRRCWPAESMPPGCSRCGRRLR
jgi:hypothetical protein